MKCPCDNCKINSCKSTRECPKWRFWTEMKLAEFSLEPSWKKSKKEAIF